MARPEPPQLPTCRQWLDAGAPFDGEASQSRLPTLTRAISKQRPPRDPAGIGRMAPHEIERWRQDRFAQPAYQYCDPNCVTGRTGVLRKPSAREREALSGFDQDHTIPSVPSAMLSSNAREAEYVRKALLGNSFSCPVVVWLLGYLLFDSKLIARRPSLTEVSLGVPLRLATLAPVPSTLPAEAPAALPDGIAAVSPEEMLVKRLAGLCDHQGSDVRIGLEAPLRPCGWPRAETPARWWRWKTATSSAWQAEEHINILELRAALATLRWRSRQR